MIKRAFEPMLAVPARAVLAIPLLAVDLWIRASSQKPTLYWSQRVSAIGRLFLMPKFRSVQIGAPAVATHLLRDPTGLRRAHGLDQLQPGLTGWAQVNGRNEIPITDKMALDAEYLRRQPVAFDVQVIALTVSRVLHGSDVSH